MLQSPPSFEWLKGLPIRGKKRFDRDSVIVSGAVAPPRPFFLILSGSVRLSLMSAAGREHAMIYLGRGSFFGEQAAIAGSRVLADLVAIAEEPCELGLIMPADVISASRESPEVFRDLMRVTAEKTSLFLEEFERVAFGSARSQLAALLCKLAQDRGSVRISQERLARVTGRSRVTAAAQLRVLAALGAIRLERARIIVLSPELLSKLAQTG